MTLFEVAILEAPTKKQIEDEGIQERLVFGPQAIIARDAQSAGIAAVLDSPSEIKVEKSRMRVLVRPFA
ncbi:hypothetical protein LCGC14_0671660 [marine sediment metagenome]|uniref:Uncharacterized protein n=1 Tax=marine sediment metagenome TaxID=412755 RepID=A0A0F9QQT7_9ZZZZ